MNTKTVEADSARRHGRPPLLRAFEYLLYAVLFVVLVVPPAFVYGLIIKDAANFREYEDVWNFYDTPGFSYGAYRVEKDWTAISDYSKIPAGEKFEYTIDSGWRSSTYTFTMVENPVYTLEDGMSVMLWRREDDGLLTYVLENGHFLLTLSEPDYVDDNQVGRYCVLPDEVEEKILSVAKARHPYDVEQSLERAYKKAKGLEPCYNYGFSVNVGYNVGIGIVTDEYVFVGMGNFDVDENGEQVWYDESPNYIFDRHTGEQVSIDRFCAGGSFEAIRSELTRRMFEPKDDFFPPYVDYEFTDEQIALTASRLEVGNILFREDGLYAEVHGKLGDYPDAGYAIGAHWEAIEDLIAVDGIVERVG